MATVILNWRMIPSMSTERAQILLIISAFCWFLSFIIGCVDFVNPNMYLPAAEVGAVFLVIALVAGIAAWANLSTFLKIVSGVFVSVSALTLPAQISWCVDNTVHPRHFNELMNLNRVAERASESKDYAKAEEIYQLISQKEQSGWFREHSFNELALANVLEEQNKFAEAEQIYRQCIERLEHETTGVWRQDTLTSAVQNLGIMYLNQKRYVDAEPLFKRALALHKQKGDHT